jgi:hypothetical protein
MRAPVVGLDGMPRCVGTRDTPIGCRLRPRKFLLGGHEPPGARKALVFAAVCPLHFDEAREFIAHLSPLGCSVMEYDERVLRHFLAESDATGLMWQLIPGEGVR